MIKNIPTFLMTLFIGACSSVYDGNTLQSELGKDDVSYSVNLKWWESYNDKELNRLVEMALNNNLDLVASAVRIQQAMITANLVGLDKYPTLAAGLGAGTSKDLKNGGEFQNNFSGEFSINYEADLWSKIANQTTAKKNEAAASVMDDQSLRLVIINNVIDMYFHMAYLEQAYQTTNSSIKNYEQILEIAKTKYKYGKIDAIDIVQIEQSIVSAKNGLLEIESQKLASMQTMYNILNLRPDQILDIKYSDLTKVKPVGIDMNVPMSVVSGRPDLKASELRLKSAFHDYRAMDNSWYPTITLGAAIASSGKHVENAFSVPFLNGSAALNLPFLSWNTVKNNIKLSESEYELRRIEFEQNITTALNEVSYYNNTYSSNVQISNNLNSKYKAAKQVTKHYRTRYQNGKLEIFDLLNIMNAENTTKLEYLNSIYTTIKSENMLFKATAGRFVTDVD